MKGMILFSAALTLSPLVFASNDAGAPPAPTPLPTRFAYVEAASAPGNLSALLDDILARLPQTHVIVAQIIPFRRGPEQGHQSYNAAIPAIVASKGPRVSMVDMQTVLSSNDYADGLHPNAGGYDKMARAWETAIRAVVDREKGVKSRLRVE